MGRTRVPLRVFLALMLAVGPVLALGIAADALGDGLFADGGTAFVGLTAAVFSIVWILLLTVAYSRALAADARELVASAREREPAVSGVAAGDEARQRLSRTLEDRDQRIAGLAADTGNAPIGESPVAVASHVVGSTRRSTDDGTWALVIVRSGVDDLLPAGVYGPEIAEPDPIAEMHGWAAVATADGSNHLKVIEGPWGAFAVLRLPTLMDISALLMAPWEGRSPPSAADRNLLELVARHAGTTLEHALLYARVRLQSEAIERMASLQRDFLRGVTHDLQTPLTSIRAVADELRHRPELDEATRADLDVISFQSDRLRRMVAQLLTASRLEAGAIVTQQEVFAVEPIIERTWAALRADRPYAMKRLGEPHLAVADPDRVEQVLWALLDNAVKYSPPGSPIEVQLRGGNGSLSIGVTDQGSGMDRDTKTHAFEQFYRSDAARRLAPDGSGVGLYAARGLVEAMGGSIRVESTLGQGSTLTITLPGEAIESAAAEA